MAMTATISLNSAGPLIIAQEVMAIVVVSNSGGSNVQVLEIDPVCIFTGNPLPMDGSSYSKGHVPLNGNVPSVVPAGGSVTFQFFTAFHYPSINFDHTAGTYSVSCNIICSDGSLVTPTAATIQVNQVPKEASTP